MQSTSPRLAARALIVSNKKLLLVNATQADDGKWCTPGGGIEASERIKEGLKREVYEETGLTITVNDLAHITEFFDAANNTHQVDLFFNCSTSDTQFPHTWTDSAGVVTKRGFFSLGDMKGMNILPRVLKTDIWLGTNAIPPIYQGWEERT